MPSDRRGCPDPLARLADALAEVTGGVRPTPLELAELLWLARQMDPAAEEHPNRPAAPPASPRAQDPPPRAAPERPLRDAPAAPPVPDPEPAAPRESPRVPLHLPAADSRSGRYSSLLAPAPPMLRHPLAVQRALRPVKRRADAPLGHRLDEHATVDRIARLGADPEHWLPVLRPARERWLRLNLVHDTGPTMPIWRPLVRELHTALAQSGIFRTVAAIPATPDGRVGGHGALDPADGRTVTLIVSDCMGPQWRPGPAGSRWHATLRRWTRRQPVAVVQPLPEHLWRDTALPAEPGLLRMPFTPYDGDPARYREAGVLTLPVLEPGPRWLANWAALLASAGGTALPGSAAPFGRALDTTARTDLAGLSPQELVLRFRATASPEAFRLAGHVAVGRPDLPVMRLVQRAVEPDPRPQHLAEVVLSGLLTTADGAPGAYAFRPGVRELLLRGLPRSSRRSTTELLARVGGLIDERAGSAPGEFRAVTPAAGGSGSAAADGEPFATVRQESVRLLSGQGEPPAGTYGGYRLLRRLSPAGSLWLARSAQARTTVALRLLEPVTDPARRAAFLRDAERLRALTHPHLAKVVDFGFTGDVPYLAMEHLDGVAVKALAGTDGHLLPPPLVAAIGIQLADAVTALHDGGLRHGGLTLSRMLLLPDGTLKLGLVEPLRVTGPDGPAEDLRALCESMLLLAAGTSRLELPIAPERLGRLPRAAQGAYARALNKLMSSSPAAQREGADLLRSSAPLHHAREAYWQRRYHVLGPVYAEVPGTEGEFALLEQAFLAMLLLRDGRPVSLDELRAGLWSRDEEPEEAAAVLGRIASRVRQALGPGALAALSDGFCLHTSADYVDLVRCERLEQEAAELAGRGELREARERLERALALWQGPAPLTNVPGPAARTARARLRRLELALFRQRAELDLETEDYERAVADLTGLVEQHPSDEDGRRLLLLALRGLNRFDEALEVFEEYQWSGGDDPTLLALGHELRAEYDEYVAATDTEQPPAYDPGSAFGALAAPDELPEGPFPTEDAPPSLLYEPEDAAEEAPLPQDDVPESLFAAEDVSSAAALRRVALFELADEPRDADDRPALGRAVVRLLVAAGLDRDDYGLRTEPDGYLVLLRAGVPLLGLLSVTLREFQDRVAETGGRRWRVTFADAPGDGTAPWQPPEGFLDQVLDMSGALGVVAFPDTLRIGLAENDLLDGVPALVSQGGPGDHGWYLVAHRPASAAEPIQGPFRLPARAPLPRPANITRCVVHTAYGTGFTLERPDVDGFYYEVDLTGHSMQTTELSPLVNGVPVFQLAGEASWRIADPVRAVRAAARRDPSALVREHVVDCLGTVSALYPPGNAAEARAALVAEVAGDLPSGFAVRWEGVLTPTRAALAAPSPQDVPGELADALRAADAVLMGFDGVLARVRPHGHGDFAGAGAEDAAAEPEPVANADLLLRTLAYKGKPLALVTNRSTAPATAYLARRRLLECLDGGVHGQDVLVTAPMPDPQLVLQAADRLGVRPARCLMIGSSDSECAAAQAAGVPFVYVDGSGPRVTDLLTSFGLLPLLRAVQSL
ncbi:SAV_2336 N-terminal domain-related protein [Streptomyces broussonetiae]|uniref:SAV_2336 N-terminal domain-related protein n=1 Tax=Streptomyces broussonetiae TaxID=2686304 RepID=UPI0035D7F42D